MSFFNVVFLFFLIFFSSCIVSCIYNFKYYFMISWVLILRNRRKQPYEEIKHLHYRICNFWRLLRPCISSRKYSRFSHSTMNIFWRKPTHRIPPSGKGFCVVDRHKNLRLIMYLASLPMLHAESECKFCNLKVALGSLLDFVRLCKQIHLSCFWVPIIFGSTSSPQSSISSAHRSFHLDRNFSIPVMQLGLSRLVGKKIVLTRSDFSRNTGRAWKKEKKRKEKNEDQEMSSAWKFWKFAGC